MKKKKIEQEPLSKSQPQLYLNTIEIQGFKSYLEKTKIGPLHPQLTWYFPHLNSFSSIVGPNGSGKSNVKKRTKTKLDT